MGKHVIQIAGDDDCVYIIDDSGILKRLCEVQTTDKIPDNVVETIKQFKLEYSLTGRK